MKERARMRIGKPKGKRHRVRKQKRIRSIALGCLVLLLCTGCGVEKVEFEQPQENSELSPTAAPAKDWAENTLFTINGKEVDYREAFLLLLAAKEEAEILYGKGIWDYTLDEEGTTYAMLRKEQVLEELITRWKDEGYEFAALDKLVEAVIEGRVPNEKERLLEALT